MLLELQPRMWPLCHAGGAALRVAVRGATTTGSGLAAPLKLGATCATVLLAGRGAAAAVGVIFTTASACAGGAPPATALTALD